MSGSTTSRGKSSGVEVRDDTTRQTYDAWRDGEVIGSIAYNRSRSNRTVLISIAVLEEHQHQGVAAELIAATLDDVRKRDGTVTIICPIVRDFLDHHPEYEDVVDPIRPGVHSRSHSSGDES